MWSLFHDTHSADRLQIPEIEEIYIEAPLEEAKAFFHKKFGLPYNWVSCNCCGTNYDDFEDEHLEELSAHFRGCTYDDRHCTYIGGTGRPLKEYLKLPSVLVITKEDMEKEGR